MALLRAETSVPYQELVNHFDIQPGDILLVVSEVLALAAQCLARNENFDPALFLGSIERRLGEHGTLLVPTFNFEFSSGRGYDIKTSLPVTGAVPRCALNRQGYSRTRHPIHSFAAWGAHREELCGHENKSSFGENSPFGFLHRHGGKMWIVGRSYGNSFTFVHYVEEREKAPYRHFKDFTGSYTDEGGRTQTQTYQMYVRDLDQAVASDTEPIGEDLERANAAQSTVINGVPFRFIWLDKAYPIIAKDIRENGGRKLHKIVKS